MHLFGLWVTLLGVSAFDRLPPRDLLLADLAVQAGLVDADTVADLIRARLRAEQASDEDLLDAIERVVDLDPAARLRLEAQVDADSRAQSMDAATAAVSRPLREALRTRVAATLAPTAAEAGSAPPLRRMPEGRYRDFLPVGEGGMGMVYLALDVELNRDVAVKLVRPPDGGDGISGPAQTSPRSTTSAAAEARFLQEAWVTGILEHPGIVPVYEVGRTRVGVPYYTMRFVRGSRTLREAIHEARASDTAARLALVEPWLRVCDAIGYAHARQVIHRDLKPENVALGDFGEVVVLDWGLARMGGAAEGSDARFREGLADLREGAELDTMEQALGTPGYMAPEALLGDMDAMGPTADVYSLGVLLFEALTGRRPFEFRTFLDYSKQVVQADAPPVATVDPGVPSGLAALCDRALAREPSARFEDASALADAVRTWQTDSERERIVERHRIAAETALTEAAALRGTARLRLLERVVAACARIDEAAGSPEAAADLLMRARSLRREGLAQEAHDARRRTLRRVTVGAAIALVVFGAVIALVLESKNADLRTSRDRAEAQERLASEERDRAEGIVNFLVADVRLGLDEIGRLDLLDDVVERVMAHYEERLTSAGGGLRPEERRGYAHAIGGLAEVLDERGRSGEALLAIDKAMDLLQGSKAIEDRHERARLRLQRGIVRENRKEDVGARSHYGAGVAELRALAKEDPASADIAIDFGRALRRLGAMEFKRGELDRAAVAFAESRSVLDAIDASGLSDVRKGLWLRERAERCHNEAGMGRVQLKRQVDHARIEEATGLWEEAYRLRPQDRRIATGYARSLSALGGVHYEAGRYAKTVELNRRAHPIAERLLGLAPDSVPARQIVAGLMLNEAWALIALGRLAAAIDVLERCLAIEEELGRLDEESGSAARRLVGVRVALGRTQVRAGRPERAVPLLQEAVAAFDGLARKEPANDVLQAGAAQVRLDAATALVAAGQSAKAYTLLEQAEMRLAGVLEHQPDNARWADLHIAALLARAELDLEGGRYKLARQAARQGGDEAGKRNDAGEDGAWLLKLADARHIEGEALWHLQGPHAAYPVLEDARRLFRAGLAARPGARSARTRFCETLVAEARMRRADGVRKEPTALLDEAVTRLRAITIKAPEERPTVRAFRAAQAALADVHEEHLRLPDAVVPRRELAAVLHAEARQSPQDMEAAIAAADAARACGVLLLETGPLGEALAHLERARIGYEGALSYGEKPDGMNASLANTLEGLVRGLAAASRPDEARGMLQRRLELPDAAAAGGASVRGRVVAWREAIQALAEKRAVAGAMATRLVARILRSRGVPREALDAHRLLLVLPSGEGVAADLRFAARLASALASEPGLSQEAREAALATGLEFVAAERALRSTHLAQLDVALAGAAAAASRRATSAARASEGAWLTDLRAGDAALAPLRTDDRFEALFAR